MKPYAKFGILVVAIIGTLGWLAAGGINETKTYYKEIKEVNAMGNDALDKRIRVGGDVEKDSIVREGKEVRFVLDAGRTRSCTSSTPAPNRCPTLSATVHRRWPTARCAPTAFFRRVRFRPSALPSTKASRSTKARQPTPARG